MSDIENKTPETAENTTPEQTQGYTLEQVTQKAAELVEKTKIDLEFKNLGGEEGITRSIFDRIKFNLRSEFPTEELRQAEVNEFHRIQEAGADPKFKTDLSALIKDGYWYLTSTQQHGENGRLLFLYNPYNKETPTKVILLGLTAVDPGFRRDDRKDERGDRAEEEEEPVVVTVSSTIEAPSPNTPEKDDQFAQFDAAVKEEKEKVQGDLKTLASQWEYRSNDPEYLRTVVKKIDEYADFKSIVEQGPNTRGTNRVPSEADIRDAIYEFLAETGPFQFKKIDELLALHAKMYPKKSMPPKSEKDQIKIAMAGESGPMEGE